MGWIYLLFTWSPILFRLIVMVAPLSQEVTSNSVLPARWLSRVAALFTVLYGAKSLHDTLMVFPLGMVNMLSGVLTFVSLTTRKISFSAISFFFVYCGMCIFASCFSVNCMAMELNTVQM